MIGDKRKLPNAGRGGLGLLGQLALGLHAVWAAGLLYVYWVGQTLSPNDGFSFELFGIRVSSADKRPDIIAAAGELGRLDLVAISLTFLGVILAIGAFIGFTVVRSAAINEAAAEAGKVTREELPKMVDYGALAAHLLREDRFISSLKAAIETANTAEDGLTGDKANAIAKAFGETSEH